MLKGSLLVLLILQGPVGSPRQSRTGWPLFEPSTLVLSVHLDRLTRAAPEVDELIRRRWGTQIDLSRHETFVVWPGSFYEVKRGKVVLRSGVQTRTYRNLRIKGRFPYGVTVWFLEREKGFFLEGRGDVSEDDAMLGPCVGDPRVELPSAVDEVAGVGDPEMAANGCQHFLHSLPRPN